MRLANKGGDFSVLGNEEIESTGEGRTYGMEFLYQQKLYKNIYAIFAYTLFKSEYTNIDGIYLPSVWDSRQLISFTGGYKTKNNWEFSARYRYAGPTPFAPVDEETSINTYPILILDYNNLGASTLASFSQLDIRIDKKWNFPTLSLNVYFEAENVLAQQIPQAPAFGLARDENNIVLDPRQLSAIEQAASTVIPTIGIAIDF